MWESQVLLTDGQMVFLWVLRFSPTFDERSAQYKWNILERAVKPKSKKKKKSNQVILCHSGLLAAYSHFTVWLLKLSMHCHFTVWLLKLSIHSHFTVWATQVCSLLSFDSLGFSSFQLIYIWHFGLLKFAAIHWQFGLLKFAAYSCLAVWVTQVCSLLTFGNLGYSKFTAFSHLAV